MPQINDSDWNVAASGHGPHHTSYTPKVIEGNSTDITGREDIDLDTVDLASEPDFPVDLARDREPTQLELLVQQIPYGPLRQLDPKRLHTKWRLIEQLTPTIPLNQFDMPEFIYRADLLDHTYIQETLLKAHGVDTQRNLANPSPEEVAPTTISPADKESADKSTGTIANLGEIQEQLHAAMVSLDYYQGFPTIEGVPLWRRMDFEPENAHDAFIAYLEQSGTRQLHELIAYDRKDLQEWFHTYYWGFRCKSFDMFAVASAQRTRIQRMLRAEDSHYVQAERILAQLKGRFDNITAEELTELGLEKAVSVFEKLVKVQRISVGLPANGSATADDEKKTAPTTNIIMQQIAEKSPEQRQTEEEQIDILADSPEFLEEAQKLIIKMQQMQDQDE